MAPYYQFGYQRRYAYNWSGDPGGIMPPHRAAESAALGVDPLTESFVPYEMHFPPFSRGRYITPSATGDWPAVRPSGPEPLDPGRAPRAMGLFDGLSRSEKSFLLLASAGAAAWFFLRKKK